jgi:MFS transporter, DHA1 family, multidrug resistance protein
MLFLGALCAVGPLSIDMYLPAMPHLVSAFHITASEIQLSIAIYLGGVLVGQLIYGFMSDRYGRKPPLYAGLLIYSLSSYVCSYAGIDWFIAMRFFQGLGGSVGTVIARAMIRDRMSTSEAARAFSTLMLVVSVAPLTAPLLGTALLEVGGWRAIFVLMGLFGTLLLMTSMAMPETLCAKRAATSGWWRQLQILGRILWDRSFLTYTLSNGFLQGGMYAYISMSSFVVVNVYEKSPRFFSIVFAINSLGMVVAAQFNSRLTQKVALARIVEGALWVSVASSMVLVSLPSRPAVAVLLVVILIYLTTIGFVAPNAAALALTRHAANAGSASALLGTLLFGIGALSGAIVSRVLVDAPTRALVWVMASSSVLATVMFYMSPGRGQ